MNLYMSLVPQHPLLTLQIWWIDWINWLSYHVNKDDGNWKTNAADDNKTFDLGLRMISNKENNSLYNQET